MPVGVYERTEEYKKSMIGNRNPFYGKYHTEEAKEKNRQAHLGKYVSQETKEKMSESMKGKNKGRISPMKNKHHSEETKRKSSKSHTGKYPTKETKEKMSESAIKRMEKQWKDGKVKWCNTDIEIKMKKALKKEKIKFKFQKYIKEIGRIDFLLNNKIIIECDGDYPHANPSKYKPNDLIYGRFKAKDIWKKNKEQDKRAKKLGYKMIRFYGSEIDMNLNGCLKRIKEEV